MAAEEDHSSSMFKVVIIGPVAVGKTALMSRYFDNQFFPTYNSSVGVDFKEKRIARGKSDVRMQVWDTAGQERYRAITKNYYRGASGFLVMFDLTNKESFNNMDTWVQYAREITSDDVPIVMVGNKCDMIEERKVNKEDCLMKAQSIATSYMETSTKDNINIKETFELLLDSMLADEEGVSQSENTVITMGDSENSTDGPTQSSSCFKC